MAYNEGTTWLGIGLKFGGILGIGGAENTEGIVFNIANPSTRATFRVQSARFGLGLGGGVGLVAACIFNCSNINQLDHTETGWDWSIGLSLGGRAAQIASSLRNLRFFSAIARVGTALRLTVEDLEVLRNGMHWLYSAYDIGTMANDQPKVILIDTPIGEGIEASFSFSNGTIEIHDIVTTQRGVTR